MARLEVLEVRHDAPKSGRIGKFSIDRPTSKTVSGNAGLHIDGWLVGHEKNTANVVVFCQGSLLRTAHVNLRRPDVGKLFPEGGETPGFSTAVSTFELPREFELVLGVVYANGEIVPLAAIKGRHEQAPVAKEGFLQPLVVTSLGRSGTTFLMKLLSAHPEIVVHRQHPYESKVGAYFMHTLRSLTQAEIADRANVTWEQGDWAKPPFQSLPTASWKGLEEYLDAEYGELAANFCAESAEGFYRRVEAEQGQKGAKFFCEKMPANGLMPVFSNVYGGAKEIFLIRDFRDVAASIFAFNAKRGFAEFGRAAVGSDAAYIPELRKAVERLLENVQARKGTSLIVRYEELMSNLDAELERILAYAGLAATPEVRRQMEQFGGELTGELKAHRTTASVEDSMGRWQRDLSPELQKLCRDNFDDILPEFGYTKEQVAAGGGGSRSSAGVVPSEPAAAAPAKKRWFQRFI